MLKQYDYKCNAQDNSWSRIVENGSGKRDYQQNLKIKKKYWHFDRWLNWGILQDKWNKRFITKLSFAIIFRENKEINKNAILIKRIYA